MSDFQRSGGVAGCILIVIVAVILTIGSGRVAMAAEPQLRGIWMHAWFVNGAYGHPQPLHVLDQHPDGSSTAAEKGARCGTTWASSLQEWKTVDPVLERILPGLCIYTRVNEGNGLTRRDAETIFTQYRMCLDQGARGTNFYSLDGTAADPVLLVNEPLIEALRDGPVKEKVPAYRPPARGLSRQILQPERSEHGVGLIGLDLTRQRRVWVLVSHPRSSDRSPVTTWR